MLKLVAHIVNACFLSCQAVLLVHRGIGSKGCRRQLVTLCRQVGGYLAYLYVFVVNEELFSLEPLVSRVGHRLVQDALKRGIFKMQPVDAEVVSQILCHVEVYEVAVGIFHVAVDNVVAVAYDHLHEHALHLRRLLQRRGHRELLRCICVWWVGRCLLPCLLLLGVHAVAAVAYELVHGVDERRLVHAHPHGTLVQVGVAQDLVLHERDAPHDRVDGLGAFQRIALVLEQQVGLKLHEVGLVLLDIFLEVGSCVLACERVGVVAVGQQQHLEVHAFRQQHVGAS